MAVVHTKIIYNTNSTYCQSLDYFHREGFSGVQNILLQLAYLNTDNYAHFSLILFNFI